MNKKNLGELKDVRAFSLERSVLKPFQKIKDFDQWLDEIDKKSRDEKFRPILFVECDGAWIKLEKTEHFDFESHQYCFKYRDWVATPFDRR